MTHDDDQALRRSPLFAGLEEPTLARLFDSLGGESWAARCQITGPGEALERFRVIVSGRVKLVRSNCVDGCELTLWLLGPGDDFDVVSLLDGRPHAVSVWALAPVRTRAVRLAQWSGWLRRVRPLDLAAHRYSAAKLRETEDLTTDPALHDTATRLANLLRRHFHGRQPNLLHHLAQRELAAMIGAVRAVAAAFWRRSGRREWCGGTAVRFTLWTWIGCSRAPNRMSPEGRPVPTNLRGLHR